MIVASDLVEIEGSYLPIVVYAALGTILILVSVLLFGRSARRAWSVRKAELDSLSPGVDPACLAGKRFVPRRRGYDPQQVTATMRALADAMVGGRAIEPAWLEELEVVAKGWDREHVSAVFARVEGESEAPRSRGRG